MSMWVILGVVAVAAVFIISLYNRLVALRQVRGNAFADIDVQLRQRLDLLPNLVETVKGYAAHEKDVLQNVTNARARVAQAGSAPTPERLQAEAQLSGAMLNLFAVAENYPQLKADQNFLHLQTEISDTENKIAAARRFFNNATNEYNTAAQQFPANIIAGMFGFKTEEFLEMPADVAARMAEPPVVKF